jgi:hypothetical protein
MILDHRADLYEACQRLCPIDPAYANLPIEQGFNWFSCLGDAHETQHVFGGVGGSHAYVDTKTGTTFALTKNRLTPTFDTAEQVAGIVTKAVAES